MATKNSLEKEQRRQATRLGKLLAKDVRNGQKFQLHDRKLLVTYNSRVHSFPQDVYENMISEGELRSENNILHITKLGFEKFQQRLSRSSETNSLGKLTQTGRTGSSSTKAPTFNKSESPLAKLYARKQRDGSSYITDQELLAGERLRADFERGQLQPRISASFEFSIRGAGYGLQSDLSDFAIDARRKLTSAIEFLGPNLSGVALDVCCFLKGMELVERERGWPPRSAKLMLKTALFQLAYHYGYTASSKCKNQTVEFWGAENYRPSINNS